MANALYTKWKQEIMKGTANTDLDQTGTDGVWCALIDTGTYTFSTSHQYYSDLSGVVGTPVELTTPTFTDGVFDAHDANFTAVSGATVEAVVLYRKTSGSNSTWPLVAYLDSNITGLPITPSGGNINIVWNASGIFAL